MHRGGRAHRHHPAATGRHDEQLLVAAPGAQRRQREAGRGVTDRQLDEQRQQPAAGGVGHLDAPGGGVADGDPGGLDVDPDAHPGPPDGQRQAREHEHEAGDRDHRQLDPGVAGGEPPRHQPHGEHGPAQRRDPAQHLEHGVPDRPGRLGDRPDPAAGQHEDPGPGLGQRRRHLHPGQRDRAGTGVPQRPRAPCGAVAGCRARPSQPRPRHPTSRASRTGGARDRDVRGRDDPASARSDARVTVAPSSAGDDGAAAGARSERRVVDPTSSRGSVMTRGAPWGVRPRRGSG